MVSLHLTKPCFPKNDLVLNKFFHHNQLKNNLIAGFDKKMRSNITHLSAIHKHILYSFLLLIPLGIGCKFYNGPFAGWVQNGLTDILYVLFWNLLVFYFRPDRSAIGYITVGVFAGTCLIEISQLWHPVFLDQIRSSFPGAVLLGTTFVWQDFVYYLLGSAVALFYLRFLVHRYGD